MSDQSATTSVDLMRHGEPEGGTRFRGWLDDPLSKAGWNQMHASVSTNRPWQHIVTSPLSRCRAFAETLANEMGIELQVDDRFREIGFGDWEGRTPNELYQQQPEQVAAFWHDPVENPPPNGESMVRFQARVEVAWQDLQIHHGGKHVLLVAHGGVNRLIISHALGMPLSHLFRMEIPYAGVSRICIDNGIPRLAFHCGQVI